MTEFSPGHDYGTETIEGVAERLPGGIRKVHCGAGSNSGPTPTRRTAGRRLALAPRMPKSAV